LFKIAGTQRGKTTKHNYSMYLIGPIPSSLFNCIDVLILETMTDRYPQGVSWYSI